MPIYKKVNYNFFKKWSTEMAYVLGFFAADGTMIMNKRGAHFIEFHLTDREILEKIKKVLESNHKISIRNYHNRRWKTGYRLQIGSKVMFADLLKLGLTPNKSLSLNFPRVPTEFLQDFIRGYFDGDGCVYFKKHFAKDRQKEKWVFNSRFTCGSLKFLKSLRKNIKGNEKGGFIVKKQNSGYELVFSHKDSLALYKLMYNNVSHRLYLDRKYKLFRKALETLYGRGIIMRE